MTGEPTIARVLIVDDIEENLIALEALLRRLPGVEILVARSGAEALELLLVNEIALALLDVNMPEMDGFQLAELMRGSQRTRDVPIMFVTAAHHDPQRIFQGYEAGAVDFLIKPVEPRILKSKVMQLLEVHRSRLQLAEQKQKLVEVLRLHETFVAAVNHDLRTPLHTLSVGLSLLVDNEPSPEQKEVARRMENAIDRMSGMLDQLNDLARTRIGEGLALHAMPGNLGELVHSVVQEAELRGKGTPFEVSVDGDPSGTWDLTRVSRLAANLVSNALQHGDRSSGVRINIDGTGRDTVKLAVANAGVIPPDLLPNIFEPFRRGTTSKHKGLGLGLFIVQEIARAHGGTVAVTSTAASGTRFEVTLARRVD
jgi:two-component system sensor histidine kinase/response regulator